MNRNVPTLSSLAANNANTNANRSLAEYSSGTDHSSLYSSSDDESHPSTAASTAGTESTARSYARFIQKDDQGKGKNKGLLSVDDEEDNDPFADPDDNGSLL